jgi:hypothetical protein
MAIGINKKSSEDYFKHEVTPGTAVTPTTATDGYLAVSADFSSTYDKEVLESDLLTASIGKRKGQLGMQDTGGEVPCEFKGSGTEGTAPEYGNVLESLFGTAVVAAAEFDVIAGSTTTVLKVGSGEGVNYQKGQALLVKDTTNGWNVRPVASVLVDDVTLGFALPFAPAITTLLGKSVLYKPANSGHKHGTLGIYWGDDVSEKIAGCLVESASIEISTGQIIKSTFAFKGLNNTRALGSAPHTPTYDTTNGLVGLDVEAWMDGTKVDFASATIGINNEIAELLSAKEVSGKVSSRPRARTIEVSMVQYVDDASLANQTKFNALTDFGFTLVAGKKASGNWVPGTVVCLYMPSCYFTAAPFADEDDILTEELTFMAHVGNGDEIFLNYL